MATVFFSSQRRVMGERRREGNGRKSLNLWHLQNKIYEIPSDYIYSESFICVFAPGPRHICAAVKWRRQSSVSPRTPSVCPPPLSGLCWFNPGGQQPGLTAPRHCHVIYDSLREWRGDDHSDLTPAVLSATHQEGDDTQTHRRLLIEKKPWAILALRAVRHGNYLRWSDW